MSWRDWAGEDGAVHLSFDFCDDFSSWRFDDGAEEREAAREAVGMLGLDVSAVPSSASEAEELAELVSDAVDELRFAALEMSDDVEAAALFRRAERLASLADLFTVSDGTRELDGIFAWESFEEMVLDVVASWSAEFGPCWGEDVTDYDYDAVEDGVAFLRRHLFCDDLGDRVRVSFGPGWLEAAHGGRHPDVELHTAGTVEAREILRTLMSDAEEAPRHADRMTAWELVKMAEGLAA
jgi:hypothetical protein